MLIRRNSLGSVALSDPSARRLKVTIGRDGVVPPPACGLASLPVPGGRHSAPGHGKRDGWRLDGETGRKINHRQSCCFLPDITLSKR